jgi:hypothetical protein
LGVQHVSHILDDFIFFAPKGSTQCKKDLITFMALCQQVGLPIKMSKTVWPATKVQLHGIEADTATMHLRLPQDKLVELRCKVYNYVLGTAVIFKGVKKVCSHTNKVLSQCDAHVQFGFLI